MSDSNNKESKIARATADLDKALQLLRKKVIAQVRDNPDFYGDAILDVNLRAGLIVTAKSSVGELQKF